MSETRQVITKQLRIVGYVRPSSRTCNSVWLDSCHWSLSLCVSVISGLLMPSQWTVGRSLSLCSSLCLLKFWSVDIWKERRLLFPIVSSGDISPFSHTTLLNEHKGVHDASRFGPEKRKNVYFAK